MTRLSVAGFPNFCILYGPSTNPGDNSIPVMLEAQADYVIDLGRSVWSTVEAGWYKLADGAITDNRPHGTMRYRRLLRHANLEYHA